MKIFIHIQGNKLKIISPFNAPTHVFPIFSFSFVSPFFPSFFLMKPPFEYIPIKIWGNGQNIYSCNPISYDGGETGSGEAIKTVLKTINATLANLEESICMDQSCMQVHKS